jgi:hypothetical protein
MHSGPTIISCASSARTTPSCGPCHGWSGSVSRRRRPSSAPISKSAVTVWPWPLHSAQSPEGVTPVPTLLTMLSPPNRRGTPGFSGSHVGRGPWVDFTFAAIRCGHQAARRRERWAWPWAAPSPAILFLGSHGLRLCSAGSVLSRPTHPLPRKFYCFKSRLARRPTPDAGANFVCSNAVRPRSHSAFGCSPSRPYCLCNNIPHACVPWGDGGRVRSELVVQSRLAHTFFLFYFYFSPCFYSPAHTAAGFYCPALVGRGQGLSAVS